MTLVPVTANANANARADRGKKSGLGRGRGEIEPEARSRNIVRKGRGRSTAAAAQGQNDWGRRAQEEDELHSPDPANEYNSTEWDRVAFIENPMTDTLSPAGEGVVCGELFGWLRCQGVDPEA